MAPMFQSMLVVLATLFVSGFGATLKCPFTTCTCEDTTIDCSNRHLLAIPPLVAGYSAFFTHLDLSGNNISTIGDNALPVHLDTLDLRGNPIKELSPLAFSPTPNLHTLRFSKPAFTSLPPALRALDNLQVFQLSDVTMKTLDSSLLAHLGKTVVDLTASNIGQKGFPTWLHFFPGLQKLDVHDNYYIGLVPATSLKPWGSRLTHLNMANTGQTNPHCLQYLTSLEVLDLSRNKLASATDISYQLIQSRNTLKELNLQSNSIPNLPRLGELQHLTHVNLADNKMTTGNVDALPLTVTHLTLEGNLLTTIPDIVKHLPLLEEFNIEQNKLTALDSDQLPARSKLVRLSLGNNPITSVHHQAFATVLQVEYLSLGFTSLTRLPLALTSLKNLVDLWLPGNTKLECTCDELALADWFTQQPAMHVVGECKNVDIREFFSTAPTLCQGRFY